MAQREALKFVTRRNKAAGIPTTIRKSSAVRETIFPPTEEGNALRAAYAEAKVTASAKGATKDDREALALAAARLNAYQVRRAQEVAKMADELRCPACDLVNKADAEFCEKCGCSMSATIEDDDILPEDRYEG
jgi:hypothetical protein